VLSVALYTATQLEAGEAGDAHAAQITRILTPLLKFRSARDNLRVATGAMEMRGGNGYIEEWVNARLVRDAHLGVLWEGTSNINAIDVVRRAVAKSGAQRDLGEALKAALGEAREIPQGLGAALVDAVDRATAFAERVAREADESRVRQAASALYHATSAALLAVEGARLGRQGRDARRLLLARLVLEHRLRAQDPLEGSVSDARIVDALLDDAPLPLARAQALV